MDTSTSTLEGRCDALGRSRARLLHSVCYHIVTGSTSSDAVADMSQPPTAALSMKGYFAPIFLQHAVPLGDARGTAVHQC